MSVRDYGGNKGVWMMLIRGVGWIVCESVDASVLANWTGGVFGRAGKYITI